MRDLFSLDDMEGAHSIYKSIVVGECPRQKAMCETMYKTFQPYSDRNFVEEFKRSNKFHARFWEMDLCCTLIGSGLELIANVNSAKGPDFCARDNLKTKCWVEAICPTKGEEGHSDSVRPWCEMTAYEVDSEKIMLRLTGAIKEKYEKHKKYLESGFCESHEPFVIAINGSQLTPGPGLDDCIPRIVKAVFEGGSEVFYADRETRKYLGSEVKFCPEIEKSSGHKVHKSFFRSAEFSGISAILYSDSSISARPADLGGDYILIRNPFATAPISETLINFGIEYVERKDEDGSVSFDIEKNYRVSNFLYADP